MQRYILALVFSIFILTGCGRDILLTPQSKELVRGEVSPKIKHIIDDSGVTVLTLLSGFRSTDDPCRVAGETATTSDFLDHTKWLVACPDVNAGIDDIQQRMNGKIIHHISGYTLLVVPK